CSMDVSLPQWPAPSDAAAFFFENRCRPVLAEDVAIRVRSRRVASGSRRHAFFAAPALAPIIAGGELASLPPAMHSKFPEIQRASSRLAPCCSASFILSDYMFY